MSLTIGAHFLDDLAGQQIADLALSFAGLSAASDWRAYEAFLDPYDTESDQRGYAFGYPNHTPPIPPQSCCTKFLLAVARAAGKDGTIEWKGRRVDVLRMPQAAGLVGMSPALAKELGRQNGILIEPTPDERPDLRPGFAALIGGDDGLPQTQRIYGGMAHGLVVTGVRDDGTLDTVEGGKGPGGTVIATDHREVFKSGRTWWVRTVGAPGARMLRWLYPLAALPEVRS